MNRLTRLSATLALTALWAIPAAALVESSYLQWQESGDTVPNSSDVRVYARYLKTGCTGACDSTECADVTKTLFYRAQGESTYSSLPMQLNIGDCYTPEDEHFADIPFSALSGDSVFFYCEFGDVDGVAAFTARPGSPGNTFTAANPAYYLVQDATSETFTLFVTGDFHCVTPNGAGPGISGSFNGWTYQPMVNTGGGIYTYDIVWPAGSATTIEFKFRNGTNWESLAGGPFANREYTVAPGATNDTYFGYWNNEEECPCPEAPLGGPAMRIFAVDMNHQNPALYAAGVGIRGNRAPLSWGTSLMLSDVDGDRIYTGMVTFPAGSLNTLEYKFVAHDAAANVTWENALPGNRRQCLAPGFLPLDPVFFDNYEPAPGTTVPITVHFSQNMNCVGEVVGVSLQGSVAPLDWNAGSVPMSDIDEDGIWTADVVFPAGSDFNVEYKTTYTVDGVNWNWEDNVLNRPFTLSDDMPEMTLPETLWDDWFCPTDLSIEYISGQVELSWTAVPQATAYHIYSSTDGYGPFTLLSTVTGTSATLPATGRSAFVVTAEK